MQPLLTSESCFDSKPALRASSTGRPSGRSVGAKICAHAGVAQLVEHRFCKPKVRGSSPLASSARFASSAVPFEGAAPPPSSEVNSDSSSPRTTRKSGASYLVGGGFPRASLRSRGSVAGGDAAPRGFATSVRSLCVEGVAKDGARGLVRFANIAGESSVASGSAAGALAPRTVAGPGDEGTVNRSKFFRRSEGDSALTCESAEISVAAPSARKTKVGCPSGQREQAVNLPAYAYVGSNPTPTTAASDCGTVARKHDIIAGVTQLVECQPSKLNVASSNLVSRSVSPWGSHHTALIAQ